MSKTGRNRNDEKPPHLTTKRGVWTIQKAGAEPVDDIERQFLEPVARYLAILQDWSLKHLSEGTGKVPQSEQP